MMILRDEMVNGWEASQKIGYRWSVNNPLEDCLGALVGTFKDPLSLIGYFIC